MELSLAEILVLAVVQGVTEFLPVSSDGHLVVVSHWMQEHGKKPPKPWTAHKPRPPLMRKRFARPATISIASTKKSGGSGGTSRSRKLWLHAKALKRP